MKVLVVYLTYRSSFVTSFRQDQSFGLALPVKVLDSSGTIIADGLASLQGPVEFELSNELQTVFVRLAWPSGKTETQRVILLVNAKAEVSFSDAKIADNDWSAWAIPLLKSSASQASSKRLSNASSDAYLKVWLRIWQFEKGEWQKARIIPSMQYKSDVARQLDLDLDAKPYLLQVGGSRVPWRFVALPGSGLCRILLTPNDSKDPRADSLKIVVTSFRTSAEMLLEFLSRDSVRAANIMANSTELAVSLFAEKFTDPIAAIAGAYYLLRIEDWNRIPLWWWENLSNNFNWIPDGAIVHCIRLLRAGLKDDSERRDAINLFKACIDRGWPVYEEGLQLLQEAGSLLRYVADRNDAEYFVKVESLITAKIWAGATLSFYGKVPTKPSAVLWVGMPYAPRRRRLARPEWMGELIEKNQEIVEDMTQTKASKVSRQMSSLSFAKEFVAQRSSESNALNPRAPNISSLNFSRAPVLAESRISAIDDHLKKKQNVKKDEDWLLMGDIGS